MQNDRESKGVTCLNLQFVFVAPLSLAAIFKYMCLCKSMKPQGGKLTVYLLYLNYVYVSVCALVVMYHNHPFTFAITGFVQDEKIILEYNVSFQMEESLVSLPALSHANH